MYGDKQYGQQGRFLYPTPTTLPEDEGCRTFRIPADPAWYGLLMGALSALTNPDNYQQFEGGLTPQQAADCFFNILETTYENAEDGCNVCTLPDGTPIIRIAAGGAVEQLTPEGWQTPTGDMTPPDIPPREGGTPQDQMCLAAANATNAFKLLYENLSDSYAGGLTSAEALTELLLAIAAIIAAAVALWAAAIIALVAIVWEIIYDTLEFVTADLWTTDFDDIFKCILLGCATNTAGVITFDYDCVIANLAAQTDPLSSLTADQLRLFGQLAYILQFIGAEGLNAAGATTAIAVDTCVCFWCYTFRFATAGAESWTPIVTNPGGYASTIGGSGWVNWTGKPTTSWYTLNNIQRSFTPTVITEMYAEYDNVRGSFTNAPSNAFNNVKLSLWLSGAQVQLVQHTSVTGTNQSIAWGGVGVLADEIRMSILTCDNTGAASGSSLIKLVRMEGQEPSPFGDNNCD